MDIRAEGRGETLLVYLVGSLDALTAYEASEFLRTQVDNGHRQVVLDLGQVDFMSSSGIRVLLETLKQSRREGGDLRLAAAQPGVRRTLELSGLVRVVKMYHSVEEAVSSFAS